MSSVPNHSLTSVRSNAYQVTGSNHPRGQKWFDFNYLVMNLTVTGFVCLFVLGGFCLFIYLFIFRSQNDQWTDKNEAELGYDFAIWISLKGSTVHVWSCFTGEWLSWIKQWSTLDPWGQHAEVSFNLKLQRGQIHDWLHVLMLAVRDDQKVPMKMMEDWKIVGFKTQELMQISASQFTTKWKLQMFMKMTFKTRSGSCCCLTGYACSER